MEEVYIPIYKGSLRVVYEPPKKILRVEYIDVKKSKTRDDYISKLFSEYVSGRKIDFNDVDIEINGLTKFQIRVYNVLREIPYGEVRSYKWVANKLNINSPRAVGQALKRNPFLIVVPCHRVIRSDGSLGGFTSIHGTEFKKFLLRLEGVEI